MNREKRVVGIERLWMYSGVSCLYTINCSTTFKWETWPITWKRSLYCLRLVYLNEINTALKAFQDGWNNDVITTEHSMMPVQLFTSGVLLSEHWIATIDHSQRNSSELERNWTFQVFQYLRFHHLFPRTIQGTYISVWVERELHEKYTEPCLQKEIS